MIGNLTALLDDEIALHEVGTEAGDHRFVMATETKPGGCICGWTWGTDRHETFSGHLGEVVTRLVGEHIPT